MWRPLPAEEKARETVERPSGHIKGLALGQLLAWYHENWSRARSVQAVKLADARFPGMFDASRSTFGVLASQWYPAAAVHMILDELTRGLTTDEIQNLARSAAHGVMSSTLGGVHRMVLSTFVSPERYLKHIDTFWKLHYDTGRAVLTASAATEHRAVYVDWTSHHPFACQLNMASARPIYEAMGCHQVQYTVIGCIALGQPRCETEISWST